MKLAHAARGRWVQLASQKLHSSQAQYLSQLQVVQAEDSGASITLGGSQTPEAIFANMIEHGTQGKDLKSILLEKQREGSNSIKISKNPEVGRYRVIPFRKMLAGATGRNFPVMGTAYDKTMGETASSRMRNRIVEMAKSKSATTQKMMTYTDPQTGQKIERYRTMKWGGAIPRKEGGPKLNPEHSTGLYSGMYRIPSRKQGGPSQYLSFRTISEKGKSQWMQSPIEARDLVLEVQQYVMRIAPEILGSEVSTSIDRG
jgi:hypothetical protein